MVNKYGVSDIIDGIGDCGGSSMVFDCGTSGDFCGSGDPHRHNGHSTGDWETGDCLMVAPELEDCFSMDEVLSDIVSISADGDYISGYLRFSLQGTS